MQKTMLNHVESCEKTLYTIPNHLNPEKSSPHQLWETDADTSTPCGDALFPTHLWSLGDGWPGKRCLVTVNWSKQTEWYPSSEQLNDSAILCGINDFLWDFFLGDMSGNYGKPDNWRKQLRLFEIAFFLGASLIISPSQLLASPLALCPGTRNVVPVLAFHPRPTGTHTPRISGVQPATSSRKSHVRHID